MPDGVRHKDKSPLLLNKSHLRNGRKPGRNSLPTPPTGTVGSVVSVKGGGHCTLAGVDRALLRVRVLRVTR